MSKIGRKPIPVTSAQVELNGNHISIKGSKGSFVHELPSCLAVELDTSNNVLLITVKEKTKESNVLWGLHRALLANKIKGAQDGFSNQVKIVGLGYKAQVTGNQMVFTLGYSHKIDYTLPEGVTVAVDKTGQLLDVASSDKFLLGKVCDDIRSFRKPEPYKGTGIMRTDETIIRKAGKAKGE